MPLQTLQRFVGALTRPVSLPLRNRLAHVRCSRSNLLNFTNLVFALLLSEAKGELRLYKNEVLKDVLQ